MRLHWTTSAIFAWTQIEMVGAPTNIERSGPGVMLSSEKPLLIATDSRLKFI